MINLLIKIYKMNKSINAYKKFQFFEAEKPNEDPSSKLIPSVKYMNIQEKAHGYWE